MTVEFERNYEVLRENAPKAVTKITSNIILLNKSFM